MHDREKLIKAWETFRDSNPYQICEGKEFRAFKEPEYCMGKMIADTIYMLQGRPEIIRCKECKHRSEEMYDYYNNPNDKRYVCQINDLAKKPDWFCADGERLDSDG